MRHVFPINTVCFGEVVVSFQAFLQRKLWFLYIEGPLFGQKSTKKQCFCIISVRFACHTFVNMSSVHSQMICECLCNLYDNMGMF